ncbi:ATP-dependent DNA ligase [Arthrobacter sp. Soil762]|uniref:ATP-dependent DNA ligase n=1 Tax=Arthrobacter sp. Soil762 TaxID=1736401 RepID=UPI000A6AABFE|nr:ATP-dependent DNA ligase [Arthrobacter sp. Soil762]
MTLWSRQGRELTRVLPDLAAALGAQVPPGVVLDGEAVIWNRDRLDFEALQRRMVTSRAALPALVKELPAAFAAFDVLAVAGQDVRGVPFAGRRQLLEELAREWAAPLALSPTTTDPELAKTWLRDLPATGIEGLVFKGGSQTYDASRSWLKLKHKNVLDVVCAAVIGPLTQPHAIIAGLPIDGQLRIVGRSTVLSARAGRELGRHLRPAQPGHPWPEEISETSLNRFSKDKGPVHLTLTSPGPASRSGIPCLSCAPDPSWIPPPSNSHRTSRTGNPCQSRWTGCAHWAGGALRTAQSCPHWRATRLYIDPPAKGHTPDCQTLPSH